MNWTKPNQRNRPARVYENARGDQAIVVSRDMLSHAYKMKHLRGDSIFTISAEELYEHWTKLDMQVETLPPHRVVI